MRVLVTGATGFTGGHLARHLVARGNQVWALIRSATPGPAREELTRAGVQLLEGDLRDKASLERACAGVDVV